MLILSCSSFDTLDSFVLIFAVCLSACVLSCGPWFSVLSAYLMCTFGKLQSMHMIKVHMLVNTSQNVSNCFSSTMYVLYTTIYVCFFRGIINV